MIDFPASPVDGQIFSSATNGVVYKYSTAYTSWLAQNAAPAIGGTGDFCASASGAQAFTSTPTVMVFNTIKSGNSGSWLNTATGRYTPPAGRFYLSAAASFGPAITSPELQIRKNGTIIIQQTSMTSSSAAGEPKVDAIVDANGTDYFEIWGIVGAACSTLAGYSSFLAFPLTGLQGPTGGAPGPVVGDFCANQTSGFPALATAITVLVPNQILTGNSGAYYNTSNGRYTPPAGRYLITASFSGACTGAASNIYVLILKNGTTLQFAWQTSWGAGQSAAPCLSLIVDANGSDYFQIAAQSGQGVGTISAITFQSTPTQGMVGPQGPPGVAGGAGTGDFYATGSNIALPNSTFTLILPTVLTGNVGLWYSVSTGRWTPPVGRYVIFASLVGGGSAAVLINLVLRKNGTQITTSSETPAAAGYSNTCKVQAIVDANGSDFFDLQVAANTTTSTASSVFFGAFPLTGLQGPGGPMGPAGVTQTVFTETGAVATGTTTIPYDDTIPQITEGTEFMTLAITPQSATSKLVIEVVCFVASSVLTTLTAALYQDSTANALAVGGTVPQGAGVLTSFVFRHTMTSGTTSATTFRVRAGPNAAGTLTFNGAGGVRAYGGVMASSIVIREVP